MSKTYKKTNNDAALVDAKVQLRIDSILECYYTKTEIKILEAFGGEGVLWDKVKKQLATMHNPPVLKILSIDKNKYNRVQLLGDNLKYMAGMDLNQFDIIDLDAWGSPVDQLELVFKQKFSGIVHCTFIQTMQGRLSNTLLYANGYTPSMLKKITSIFVKRGIEKFLNYLSTRKVKKVWLISKNQKNYLWFRMDQVQKP